jgi:hypothetical protein
MKAELRDKYDRLAYEKNPKRRENLTTEIRNLEYSLSGKN